MMDTNEIRRLKFYEGLRYLLAFLFCMAGIVALAICHGCASAPPKAAGAAGRAAVVVGVSRVDPAAYGGWAGACPGTDRDAAAAADACAEGGIPCEVLLDEAATKAGVVAAAERAARSLGPDGLLLLYFSGHGGQRLGTGEDDGRDETICLYDGQLLDDTVWRLLSRVPAGVRAWMVTDCCHSGTNFRAAPPHDYAKGVRRWWRREPDLLHWGAARDGTSAVGTAAGGFFTLALREAWRPGITYADWFRAALPFVKGEQTPVESYTGADFRSREAWR